MGIFKHRRECGRLLQDPKWAFWVLSYGTVRPCVSLDNSLCSKSEYTELCNAFAGSFCFGASNCLSQCNGPQGLLIKRSPPHHEQLSLGISGELETVAPSEYPAWYLPAVAAARLCLAVQAAWVPSQVLFGGLRISRRSSSIFISDWSGNIVVWSEWESQQGKELLLLPVFIWLLLLSFCSLRFHLLSCLIIFQCSDGKLRCC